jgi:hypothetical protein
MRALAWVLGAFCGLAWWRISLLLGARSYGIVGSHAATGPVAGVLTGIAVTALSLPFYRIATHRSLLWYSPLSVYVAVGLYGLFVYAIRQLVGDFQPGQIPWGVGLQSIVGMWWGIGPRRDPRKRRVRQTGARRVLVSRSRNAAAGSGPSAP